MAKGCKLDSFLQDVLKDLISDMDIPAERKNINKPENVRWLRRNLMIKNSDHPDIREAMALLQDA